MPVMTMKIPMMKRMILGQHCEMNTAADAGRVWAKGIRGSGGGGGGLCSDGYQRLHRSDCDKDNDGIDDCHHSRGADEEDDDSDSAGDDYDKMVTKVMQPTAGLVLPATIGTLEVSSLL